MTQEPVSGARARLSAALCLLVSLLLALLVAHRAWELRDLGGFGVPATDAVALAVLLALSGGALVLLTRSRRAGLPGPALAALAVAATAAALLLWRAGTPQVGAFEHSWFSYSPIDSGAYSSTLTLSLAPELRPGTGLLVVAALGLLPVAGLLAVLPARRLTLPPRLRTATVLAAGVAALLVLRDLDRALGLRELLQWQPQQLDLADGVTAVAALWSLVALLLSATAVVRRRAGAVAVVVPFALLLGWGALLLGDPPRPTCCYSYSPMSSQGNVFRDYGVLLLGLAVGLLPLLVAQLRRVIRTASTPPG